MRRPATREAGGAEELQPPPTMSADRIEITSEVFWACSMHAMSTEVEEIMGLLLGEVAGAWHTYGKHDMRLLRLRLPHARRFRFIDIVSMFMMSLTFLAGDVVYADDGTCTVRIWAVMPQIRTDRRKVPPSQAPCHSPAGIARSHTQTCLRPAPTGRFAAGAQDRVEASPEQMARCAAFAERFSQQSNTLTRVIGW